MRTQPFTTALQGTRDANRDWKDGWVSFDYVGVPELLKEHVRSMVGGTEAYLNAYVARITALFAAEVARA